jgi:hypothetical protein
MTAFRPTVSAAAHALQRGDDLEVRGEKFGHDV